MRNTKYNLSFGITLVCAVLFVTCDNSLKLTETQASVENSYGRVSVSLVGEEADPQMARTVFPDVPEVDKYVYTFTKVEMQRRVTIDMYDSGTISGPYREVNGWNGNGALRIYVNGVSVANNVKVTQTSHIGNGSPGFSNTYSFSVKGNDIVQIYWIEGERQNENSFVVYYSDDTPPDNWSSSSKALVYRQQGTMTNISGGTLLGSFTVDAIKYPETAEVKTPDPEGVFAMEIGDYVVDVQAYGGDAEPYTLVANGVSTPFSVRPGDNTSVKVKLSEVNTGQGVFSYTITYPTGADAEIILQRWPGMADIELNPTTQGNGKTETLELEVGSYMFTVYVSKDGHYAGKSEAVHIYPDLPTEYTAAFSESSLSHALSATGITAEYTQTGTIYQNTPLDNLKADVVVTADYESGATRTLTASEYSLSGTLSSGTRTITVSYTEGGITKTTTFTVTVTQAPVAGLYRKAPPISSSDTPISNLVSAWPGATIVDKAIAYVNQVPDTYTLVLDSDIDVAGGGRTLDQAGTAKLFIIGFGAERKIRLTSSGNIFAVGASSRELIIGENITLEGLTNNNASVVFVNKGAFTMQDNASVTGNTTTGNGGGVYVYDGTFTMKDNALVSDNIAGSGGGVYVDYHGMFTMQGNASVFGNAAGLGGGVYLNDQYSVFLLLYDIFDMRDNSSVTGNIGGGIYVNRGLARMQGSASVSYNSGRGVYNGGTFYMQGNSVIIGNTAAGNGAGVFTDDTFYMQNNAMITGNAATGHGGGVSVSSGTFTMSSGTISGNTAGGYGGGVHVNTGTFTISGGTIYALYNQNGVAKYGNGSIIFNPGTYNDGMFTGK